jgi:hypothetical protein
MFIVQSSSTNAAKKMTWLMFIAWVLSHSFGALLTMHMYTKPKK